MVNAKKCSHLIRSKTGELRWKQTSTGQITDTDSKIIKHVKHCHAGPLQAITYKVHTAHYQMHSGHYTLLYY